AIGTLSLPERLPAHLYKAVRKITALRIQIATIGTEGGSAKKAKVNSAIKDCSFTIDVELPAMSTEQSVKALTK
ncbi:hypothetical protein VQ02_34115, partial [Methylobacterium variabile]